MLTYAASGHAESQNPRWLAMTSYSAHLAAMSVWVGGLAYLLAAVLPRRDPVEIGRVLPVFSRVAIYSVMVLAVSGTYQAWLGIGSIDAITSTRYGQFVLIKVALFVGLLALGNLSRVVVQRRYVRPVAYAMTADPPPSTDEPPDLGPIRRSVFAELVIALVVLAVTAVLVAEPPGPAALATTRAQPQTATTSLGGGRTATVTIEPGKHGPVSITIALSAGPKPLQVTATAALPDRQLGPIPFKLATHDGATYTASGVVLPASGRWIDHAHRPNIGIRVRCGCRQDSPLLKGIPCICAPWHSRRRPRWSGCSRSLFPHLRTSPSAPPVPPEAASTR